MAQTSRAQIEKIVLSVAILCATAVCGCHKGITYHPEDDLNIQRQLCRDKQAFTIGFSTDGGDVLLDACQADINKSISFVSKRATLAAFDSHSNVSPDGLWTVTPGQNVLLVESRTHQKFSIPLKTSVRRQATWSRDSRFFFYVTAEDYDHGRPLLGCSDDAFDLHVASVDSSTQDLVGRVCSGVPSGSLRWLYR
jgi:hypothetical protein